MKRRTGHMKDQLTENVGARITGLAAEDQLLIWCSRTSLSGPARRAAAKLLQEQLDWDYIYIASIRHNVTPLFYYGLTSVLPAQELAARVPPAILAELQRLYQGNRVRNERLYRVIAEIADAFECADIDIMGLKDVQLACTVYPEEGLRPMGDIDLLIHRDDYARAAACLNQLGFVARPDPDIPFTIRYAWAHFFVRPRDNTWVDLQWNIVQREWDVYHEGNFDFEIQRLWSGARWMSVNGSALRVPKPEDMLFHLCQHLEGHFYSEFILFCDIAELLRHYGEALDWAYVAGLAKKYHSEGTLYYALFLVEQLFQVGVPPQLWSELAPAYFQANLYFPLYDSLTTLHGSLDQIRLAVDPPPEVLGEFETVARRETVAAIQAFRTLNNLTSLFVRNGGTLVIYNGVPSERTWPDPVLPAFEPIDCLILQRDLQLLRQALVDFGFEVDPDHGTEQYMKQWRVPSTDPVLHSPTQMVAQVAVETNPKEALLHVLHEATPRETALKSLRARLLGKRGVEAHAVLPIKVLAVSPEDAMLHLTWRLGREANHLFVLCSSLELLRRYQGPLDWERIISDAEQQGVMREVCQGAAVLAAFAQDDRIPPANCVQSPPHLMQSARYPESWGQYGAFRNVYFYVLSILSIRSLWSRMRYLFRVSLLLKLITDASDLFWRKRSSLRHQAYWIES